MRPKRDIPLKSENSRKLLVIDIAALGWDLVQNAGRDDFQKLEGALPGVTCTAQAAFRTAAPVSTHGVASNGFFFRDLKKVLFWEQASSLVSGPRIWENFRARGGRVGMMFWQQSLGEEVDLVLSPTPVHKHGGGMIQSCYTMPRDLEARLNEKVGRPFNLMNYWGPLANHKSSDRIVEATSAAMTLPDAPELLLTYIPHLDYDLQRHGPGSVKAKAALDVLLVYLDRLKRDAVANGYEWLLFGDYAIEPVKRGALFPNRKLREAGLFAQRSVRGMSYADFFSAPAFAMVDHQIAHVFCRDEKSTAQAADALANMVGVSDILDRGAQKKHGLDHRNSGDLVLVAEPGAWFAYPWWSDKREAPDFATHVDIHNKPGYDPCELFFGWPPLSVSQDTKKIRGTHGRPGGSVAWASSIDFAEKPATLVELAAATKNWLDSIS